MAESTRTAKPKREEKQTEEQKPKAAEEEKADMDELLDEIDEVLESNAEEFVRGFVQKGGE